MKGSDCRRNLIDGGGMGSRTPDLLNAIQTLYQLSYTPERDVLRIAKRHTEVKPFFLAGAGLSLTQRRGGAEKQRILGLGVDLWTWVDGMDNLDLGVRRCEARMAYPTSIHVHAVHASQKTSPQSGPTSRAQRSAALGAEQRHDRGVEISAVVVAGGARGQSLACDMQRGHGVFGGVAKFGEVFRSLKYGRCGHCG